MSETANSFLLSVDALKGQQFDPMSIAQILRYHSMIVSLLQFHFCYIYTSKGLFSIFQEISFSNLLAYLTLRLTQDTILFSMEQELRSHSFCLHVLYAPL